EVARQVREVVPAAGAEFEDLVAPRAEVRAQRVAPVRRLGCVVLGAAHQRPEVREVRVHPGRRHGRDRTRRMMRPVTEPPRGAKRAIAGGGLAVIAALPVWSDPMQHDLHNYLFKATYLPLILAGLWFHLRGGLVASGLMSAFSLVHWSVQLEGHHSFQS